MPRNFRCSALLAIFLGFLLGQAVAAIPETLATLCDPAKLATLKARGANPRILKVVYWLEIGRRQGESPRDW